MGIRNAQQIRILRQTGPTPTLPQAVQPMPKPKSQKRQRFSLSTIEILGSSRSNPLHSALNIELTLAGNRFASAMDRGIAWINNHGKPIPSSPTSKPQWIHTRSFRWRETEYLLHASYNLGNLPAKQLQVELVLKDSPTKSVGSIVATRIDPQGPWQLTSHIPAEFQTTTIYPQWILGYLTWLITEPGKEL